MSERRPGHSFIRPQIRNQPILRFPKADGDLLRLHWNENPYDFPADLKEEVLQRLARMPWSRYPIGLRGVEVAEAVAKATGVNAEQVIVGHGSTDILRLIISAVLAPGDAMLTVAPTYRAYASNARQIGATVHTVDLDPEKDFALPVETIIEEAERHHVSLIALCAPNNPTGTLFSYAQLEQLVTNCDALVLLDAAYAEFCGQDLLPLLTKADNVVLVHTLSKAYALAGVRVGYALSTPDLAAELLKLVPAFALNPLSESAAIVALENQERFRPLVNTIVAERDRLAASLARLPGVALYPSVTNFLFVKVGHSGKEIQATLRSQRQILISDMGMYPGYEEYIRISVGTPEQNDLVVQELAHYLATVAL